MKKLFLLLLLLTISNSYSQVGIGTTNPSAALDLVSRGTNSATKAVEINNAASLELLTVLDNGNVGINTASPQARLDVNGLGGIVNLAGLNLDPLAAVSFTPYLGSGKLLVGWNRSAGHAEIDFINANAVAPGGFSWYDLETNGTLNENARLVNGVFSVSGLRLTSDRRLKKDIIKVNDASNLVMGLNPVTYNKKLNLNAMDYDKKEYGFIAQELEHILPELVTKNEKGIRSVDYISLISILTKAFQEQQGKLLQQEQEIKKLKQVLELKN